MENIAQNVVSCLRGFESLYATLEGAPGSDTTASASARPSTAKEDGRTPDMTLSQMGDEQSRFKVWSANIGAHKGGKSSLDYRLRDASHLRNQVIKLLKDLAESINDAKDILHGDSTPWEERQMESLESDSGSDSDLDHMEDLSMPSELSQISTSIAESINSLFRLSVSIRNPAPHDRFKQSKLTDTSHFEPFDVDYVRTKFTTAEAGIVDRLGKAISRRRQYFKYRELHHQKMASGLEDSNDDPMPEKSNAQQLQSTVASSIPQNLKTEPGSSTPPILEDKESDAGRSQTSFATSLPNLDRPKIPALPPEAEKGPFECPLCFMMVSISTRRAWKQHVFADLRPYVCLSLDCPAPDQDFQRRHQWADHIKKYHWKAYVCGFGCETGFSSTREMKAHLGTVHSDTTSSASLNSLLGICERAKPATDSEECSLCHENLPSLKSYQRHVGRHLEDLALFALPQLPGDEERSEDEQNVSEETSTRSDSPTDAAQGSPLAMQPIDASDDYGCPVANCNYRPAAAESNWKRYRDLEKHVNHKHDRRMLACPTCGKVFPKQHNLRTHQRNTCSGTLSEPKPREKPNEHTEAETLNEANISPIAGINADERSYAEDHLSPIGEWPGRPSSLEETKASKGQVYGEGTHAVTDDAQSTSDNVSVPPNPSSPHLDMPTTDRQIHLTRWSALDSSSHPPVVITTKRRDHEPTNMTEQPTSERRRSQGPDWQKFYRNGLPEEIIVVDDDSDEEVETSHEGVGASLQRLDKSVQDQPKTYERQREAEALKRRRSSVVDFSESSLLDLRSKEDWRSGDDDDGRTERREPSPLPRRRSVHGDSPSREPLLSEQQLRELREQERREDEAIRQRLEERMIPKRRPKPGVKKRVIFHTEDEGRSYSIGYSSEPELKSKEQQDADDEAARQRLTERMTTKQPHQPGRGGGRGSRTHSPQPPANEERQRDVSSPSRRGSDTDTDTSPRLRRVGHQDFTPDILVQPSFPQAQPGSDVEDYSDDGVTQIQGRRRKSPLEAGQRSEGATSRPRGRGSGSGDVIEQDSSNDPIDGDEVAAEADTPDILRITLKAGISASVKFEAYFPRDSIAKGNVSVGELKNLIHSKFALDDPEYGTNPLELTGGNGALLEADDVPINQYGVKSTDSINANARKKPSSAIDQTDICAMCLTRFITTPNTSNSRPLCESCEEIWNGQDERAEAAHRMEEIRLDFKNKHLAAANNLLALSVGGSTGLAKLQEDHRRWSELVSGECLLPLERFHEWHDLIPFRRRIKKEITDVMKALSDGLREAQWKPVGPSE